MRSTFYDPEEEESNEQKVEAGLEELTRVLRPKELSE